MKRVTPTQVEIDLEALRFNYRQLRKKVPLGVKILSVVKSNAYGHGAVRVGRILQEEGSDWFGTGTLDEAIELREAGIKRPILVLLGLVQNQQGHLELLQRYQLTPVVYDLETARHINEMMFRFKKKMAIHLKVDTGMTRLGILPGEMNHFCEELKKLHLIEPEGLLTHLAEATNASYTKQQQKLFEEARRIFQGFFPGPRLFHMANSQAVIDQSIKMEGENWMVRPGIALYGAYKPVLRWLTQIVLLKKVPAKTSVSYNRTFQTKKESLIGVLPVGYADGYPRSLSNKAEVLVKGKRAPVVGIICMDLMMIDLTKVSGVKIGDPVVLIGRQGREEIRVEELAEKAKTISYEILCGIDERVPRSYR